MVKKIAIIGPESTGKSTLSEQLASHYRSLWVPEFAREYLLKHGTSYTYDSLLDIAKGQLALEDAYIEATERAFEKNKSPYLFIDTEMRVMKVWCEFVYGKCHQWILDRIRERRYDLYLLCNTDLPWTPDPLREYPDPEPRNELFSIYHSLLSEQSTPWVIISGDYEERLQSAISAVNIYL
ncbi:MAG TPA: ATP-binding protein [Chitinophagaceae bacterium]